jgi:acyl-CoA thioester hydrolase
MVKSYGELLVNAPSTAPFDEYRDRVRPEWIDHNDHMNMGYYVVVFDLATDAWFDYFGFDDAHRKKYAVANYTLECHVSYLREVGQGDPLRFTTLLLGFDQKRHHFMHQMWHERDGYLAATIELMHLHVSRVTRRATPMAPELIQRLAAIRKVHEQLPIPPQVGRGIGLDAKPRLEIR